MHTTNIHTYTVHIYIYIYPATTRTCPLKPKTSGKVSSTSSLSSPLPPLVLEHSSTYAMFITVQMGRVIICKKK